MKVRVYYNLRKKCFSVVDLSTGRVCEHTNSLHLKNVTFKVSQAGRERVLREKQKNVHAYVIGERVTRGPKRGKSVAYNPYKYSSFVSDEKPVYQASWAYLNNRSVTAGRILS